MEHMIVSGAGSTLIIKLEVEKIKIEIYLNTSMRTQVEVILSRMTNLLIDACTGRDIVRFTNHILAVFTEKTHVMAFLNANKSNARIVGSISLQLETCFTHCLHLMSQNELELTLTDTIPIHDDLTKC